MTLSPPSSPYSTLVTVHDAITDSPIYRTGVVHWDEQFDLLDKWLSNLMSQYQQYVEKMNSTSWKCIQTQLYRDCNSFARTLGLNMETAAICDKVIPPASFGDGLIGKFLSGVWIIIPFCFEEYIIAYIIKSF